MSSPEKPTGAGLRRIRSAVEEKYGVDAPLSGGVDLDDVVRFADDLPRELTAARRREVLDEIDRLRPWLQGPFYLGGDLVIGGPWHKEGRWRELGSRLPDLHGLRVVDIGTNAGFDSFMFRRLGAEYVLGCEPEAFIEQARFLESIYRTGADFQRIGWGDLDAERHGRFHVIHCNGVLYHERRLLEFMSRLADIAYPGATVILGSMTLADPELDEIVRFVPGEYRGDVSWWWVPSRSAVRAMLESVGLEVQEEFAEAPGPPGHFPVFNRSFRAVARGG